MFKTQTWGSAFSCLGFMFSMIHLLFIFQPHSLLASLWTCESHINPADYWLFFRYLHKWVLNSLHVLGAGMWLSAQEFLLAYRGEPPISPWKKQRLSWQTIYGKVFRAEREMSSCMGVLHSTGKSYIFKGTHGYTGIGVRSVQAVTKEAKVTPKKNILYIDFTQVPSHLSSSRILARIL